MSLALRFKTTYIHTYIHTYIGSAFQTIYVHIHIHTYTHTRFTHTHTHTHTRIALNFWHHLTARTAARMTVSLPITLSITFLFPPSPWGGDLAPLQIQVSHDSSPKTRRQNATPKCGAKFRHFFFQGRCITPTPCDVSHVRVAMYTPICVCVHTL